MKLQILYVPLERIRTESETGFCMDGNIQHIIDIYHLEGPDLQDLFMTELNGPNYFPIYSFAEFFDDEQERLEELFRKQKIESEFLAGSSKDKIYVKAVLTNPHQFNEYFPHLFWNGSNLNHLSLWSLKQDVFHVEEKEYETQSVFKRTKNNRTRYVKPKWVANAVRVILPDNTTVFWVGYDGNFIQAFSNEQQFATIEDLQKSIPQNIELVFGEYGWD
ncbi:MAG: hypothetical protein ACI35P_02905 [Bacillus sp. (in: firmicutes)]